MPSLSMQCAGQRGAKEQQSKQVTCRSLSLRRPGYYDIQLCTMKGMTVRCEALRNGMQVELRRRRAVLPARHAWLDRSGEALASHYTVPLAAGLFCLSQQGWKCL
jgi:hypothetical protein